MAQGVWSTFMVTTEDKPCSSAMMRDLILRAKAGENRAFEQIMIHYQRQIFGTAIRLLANVDDARDATQDVFLRLHKYLASFDEDRDLSPWLYQITVNVCREIARKRRTTLSLNEEHKELANLVVDQDLDQEIHNRQQRNIVNQALQSLSEKERAAIVLRDIEGLETKDVARILGSSETTIRSQISMARVKIKKFRERFFKLG